MNEPTVTQIIADHYDALETGVIPPLMEFVDGVYADLEDYWPASGTFDDAAWDRAREHSEPSTHCANEAHVHGCPCRMGGDAMLAADEARLRVRT